MQYSTRTLNASMIILVIIFISFMSSIIIPDPMFDPNDDCENGSGYALSDTKPASFPIQFNFNESVPDFMVFDFFNAVDIWESLTDQDLFVYNSSIDSSSYSLVEETVLIVGYDDFLNETAIASVSTNEGNFTERDGIIIEIFSSSYKLVIEDHYDFYSSVDVVTCSSLSSDEINFTAVILHELGHVLGLHHSSDERNTMHEDFNGDYQQTLSPGDIEGFCTLYHCI